MWQQISFFIAPKIACKYSVINDSDSKDLNVLISSISIQLAILKAAIQLTILKHSYLNNFLSFQLFHADTRL